MVRAYGYLFPKTYRYHRETVVSTWHQSASGHPQFLLRIHTWTMAQFETWLRLWGHKPYRHRHRLWQHERLRRIAWRSTRARLVIRRRSDVILRRTSHLHVCVTNTYQIALNVYVNFWVFVDLHRKFTRTCTSVHMHVYYMTAFDVHVATAGVVNVQRQRIS